MKALAARRKICNRLGDRHYPPATRRDVVMREAIEKLLPRDGVFLDAGSGPNLRLASLLAGRAGLSIGLDREPIDPASMAGGARGVMADLGMVPFAAGSVDLIAMRSVIEHLDDPAAVLRGLARILRPGGSVVALAPSRWYYASIIGRLMPPLLARRTLRFVFGSSVYDNYPTWYRANTPRAMARVARRAGMVMVEARVCPHPPDYLKFSPVLFRLGVLFDRLTASVRALNVLQPSFLFILRRT